MAQAPRRHPVVPAQPDDGVRRPRRTCSSMVDFAREHEIVLVHDFAYSDTAFDGYQPPSILQVPGAKDVAVELYTLTKSFSMAGWRVGFLVGNAEIVAALAKLKGYLDYGTFQPIQIAATVAHERGGGVPQGSQRDLPGPARRAVRRARRASAGRSSSPRAPCSSGRPSPAAYADMSSMEFASFLVKEAAVAVSPGSGFGPGGEGYVRFALIENEQRIGQAVRNIKKALPKLA